MLFKWLTQTIYVSNNTDKGLTFHFSIRKVSVEIEQALVLKVDGPQGAGVAMTNILEGWRILSNVRNGGFGSTWIRSDCRGMGFPSENLSKLEEFLKNRLGVTIARVKVIGPNKQTRIHWWWWHTWLFHFSMELLQLDIYQFHCMAFFAVAF